MSAPLETVVAVVVLAAFAAYLAWAMRHFLLSDWWRGGAEVAERRRLGQEHVRELERVCHIGEGWVDPREDPLLGGDPWAPAPRRAPLATQHSLLEDLSPEEVDVLNVAVLRRLGASPAGSWELGPRRSATPASRGGHLHPQVRIKLGGSVDGMSYASLIHDLVVAGMDEVEEVDRRLRTGVLGYADTPPVARLRVALCIARDELRTAWEVDGRPGQLEALTVIDRALFEVVEEWP